jgi:Flp pilus assembly protein TadG
MKQPCALKHLSRNESGMVAPLFGLLIIPIVMLIGIAVDYSRVMRVQDRLQSSVDAAIVAAMAPNTIEAERVQKAQQMFLLNFYKGADAKARTAAEKNLFVNGLKISFVPNEDGSKIVAKVDGKVRTMFGGIAGINSIPAEGRAVVEAEQGTGQKVEIGMMIDLTGSMGSTRNGQSKIAGLKIAAQDLLDKLYPDGDDANVRVAIAPMADYVNAGEYAAAVTGLSDTGSYAKSDNLTSTRQGRFSGSYSGYYGNSQPAGSQFGATSAASGGSTYSNSFCTGNSAWETYYGYPVGVEVNHYSTGAVWISGRWYTKVRRWSHYSNSYYWDYDDHYGDWVRPNTSSNCTEAADQSGKLISCVTERTASATRYTDDAPTGGNYVGAYNQSASGSTNKLNYSADGKCYVAGRELPAIVPLTSSKSKLEEFFDNATIGGATPGHLGHAWAWYMLSPNWSSIWPSESRPAEYADAGSRKIAIIMTDGEYNTQYSNATSRAQALALCSGMKAAGVTVYTIGFGFSTSAQAGDGSSEGNAKDLLTQCSSGTNHYYFPYDSSALAEVFSNIGDTIKGDAPVMSSLKLKE